VPAPAPAVDRSVKIGFAGIGDYMSFNQDPTNLEQVGWQHSQADLRAARLILAGDLTSKLFWYFAINYNGLDITPPQTIFGVYDAYLGYRTPIGVLTIGKQKETFVYEMVALAANLPPQERVLNAFFQSRSYGAKLTNTAFNQRMTWAAGWYGLNYDGNQYTGRITGLPFVSDDDQEWVHLGVDYRYLGASNHQLEFQGRPEFDVASYYVDTGKFPANYGKRTRLRVRCDRQAGCTVRRICPGMGQRTVSAKSRILRLLYSRQLGVNGRK
jgi:phosphate-selective porin OprO and OprP